MSFKRLTAPAVFKTGADLTSDLVGIGVLLSSRATNNPNIEDTLLAASHEGMKGDYRTLALIVDWLDIHLPFVNADRLLRALKSTDDKRVLAFWIATAQRHKGDRRFASLVRKLKGKQVVLIPEQGDFLLKRHGPDPRFEKTCLKVPNLALRSRPRDIMDPRQLARVHVTYRYRVMMGPSYRADMWAQLEMHPNLTAAELARRCYGSFATAWKVIQDRKVVAA